jgi:hypothetical protein
MSRSVLRRLRRGYTSTQVIRTLLLAAGFCAVTLLPGAARAQGRPRTSVLQTTAGETVRAGLGDAVGRLIRSRAESLDVVEVTGTPGLVLSDIQLAVGCVGETEACYASIVEQLEVDALILSTLDRVGREHVLTLVFFDGRENDTRRAVHRAGTEEALLDGVDAGLRELFGLPASEEPDPGEGHGETVTQPPPRRRGPSPVGYVLGAAGIAALGAGIGLGLASQSREDDYAAVMINAPDDARRANRIFLDAQRLARAANAMFGVGGALVAAGVVVLLVTGLSGGDEERATAVVPVVVPGGGGVAARRTW